MHKALAALLALMLFAIPAEAEGPALAGYSLTYNTVVGPYVIDVWTVPDNFVNTGLAYNPFDHSLFCAHFESGLDCIERLAKFDGRRLAPPINVSHFTGLIQGLTFDLADTTLWVWGGYSSYPEKMASHFTLEGDELPDSFNMPGYPGMLEYDPERQGIWSKECNEPEARLYTRQGNVVDLIDTGCAGEGIALDPFGDSFWVMDEQRIYHMRRSGGGALVLGDYENPSHHYPPDTLAGYFVTGAAEGLVVDPSDRTLWFNADQFYHGSVPGGNRCWHIDPLGCHDQRILIPAGLTWDQGLAWQTAVSGNRLVVAPGCGWGTFIAPIVDYGAFGILSDSLNYDGDGTVRVEFRGSDAAPTTDPADNLARPYYPATQAEAGWGVTIPCPWQPDPPQARYVQVRFTLLTAAAAPDPAGTGPAALLYAPRPQPFHHGTTIAFDLPAADAVRLEVFDAQGRLARHLLNGRVRPGRHTVVWDGRDLAGRRMPTGTYVFCLTTDRVRQTRRATLIR